MKLETAHQTFDPIEAGALREMLEEAGIYCAEVNETPGMFGPTPDTAIRLLVPEDDLERARQLIEEYLASASDES